MNTISINYTLKYRIKGNNSYCVTECRKVFNIKTGKEIKKCYNSGSVGYWISGKWFNVKRIRLKKIEKINTPF
jgi:hypothetical protein